MRSGRSDGHTRWGTRGASVSVWVSQGGLTGEGGFRDPLGPAEDTAPAGKGSVHVVGVTRPQCLVRTEKSSLTCS